VARLIVARARERGLDGVTLEWVLWGDGKGPQKGLNEAHDLPATQSQEPHGQFASRVAVALADGPHP